MSARQYSYWREVTPWLTVLLNVYSNLPEEVRIARGNGLLWADRWEWQLGNLGECLREAGALCASYFQGEQAGYANHLFDDGDTPPWEPGCGRPWNGA